MLKFDLTLLLKRIVFLLILTFLLLNINTHFKKNESHEVNYTLLSMGDMTSLQGGSCSGGSGGVCENELGDCDDGCTALYIGKCSGGVGYCSSGYWQIMCYCGPYNYGWFKGCN